MRLNPKDAVMLAIQRGAKTQRAIRADTKLCLDDLTDALADLYDRNELDVEALKRREYIAA